jgi:hypothetical protein
MEEEERRDGRVLYHACVVQAIQTSAFSLVLFVLSPEKLVEKFAVFLFNNSTAQEAIMGHFRSRFRTIHSAGT